VLFHTWIFFVFFVAAYAVYLPLRRTRFFPHWLLAASYAFYAWWNPLYLLLIVYSTALDFFVVRAMDGGGRRKLWLACSVVNNLLLLGFFKYAGFVTDNLNALLAWLGAGYALPAPGAALPVGISFYTFQSMSYTIDYYRGLIPRERSFIRFATFVALFPQLVAGPIERAKNLLDQLHRRPPLAWRNVTDGASLFLVGLFKKIAIADYLALYVDRVYADPAGHNSPALALATFAFGWQIYCDFSGYTDMARGVARMMGFRLMLNFNNPYLATSLKDFWGRWHISLSTWFRDYVYIPLGGNRHGRACTYRNMFLTMVISGLWHGAAWTFVTWGAVHALGRFATRGLEQTAFYRRRVPRVVKQLGVFAFVTLAWVFFRARSVEGVKAVLGGIFAFRGGDPQFPLLMLALCLGLWAYQFAFESRLRRVLEHPVVRVALALGMILYLMFIATPSKAPFIYFRF